MKTTSKVLLVTILAAFSVFPARAADPLTEWGQRTAPGSGYALNAVAFGNGVFVAVGGNGTTLLSSDGVNWTNTSPGNFGELRKVRFLNGEFNVVGNTSTLLRSTDGFQWTTFTLPSGNYWDTAFGNGTYLVVGNSTFASTDSVNWRDAAPRVNVFPPGVKVVRFECIAFGTGEFVARPLAAVYPQEQGVFHSVDGTNWTLTSGPYESPGPGTPPPSDMTYVNGLFLIADTRLGHIHSSSNGVAWFAASFGSIGSPPGGITYGAGYFVATVREDYFGGSVHSAFFSSTNTTSWQQRFPALGFPGPGNFESRDVAFGNGTFVVVGTSNSNPIIYQSGNLSGAPTILVEPLDRAAVVNNPVSLSVLASGADPLSYQWQKNGSPMASATNSSFTISNVVATDGGGYRVVVTNSFGSVTSRVAQLSVSFLEIHAYAGITILGVPGKTYRIEASLAAGGTWTVLTNLVLPQSPYIWIDYDSPSWGTRIYRAAELQ